MCLLERVNAWDADEIQCSSSSHRLVDNPLRREGQLAAVHLVEYAAQSMAIHGALLARERGEALEPGYLAALRGIQLSVERIDDLPGELEFHSRKLMDGGGSLVYTFTASSDGRELASGRLTVIAQPTDNAGNDTA